MSLAKEHLSASHYLSLSLLLSKCFISLRLHHVQATLNMAFLCISTLGSLAQGQSPERRESSSYFVLSPWFFFERKTFYLNLHRTDGWWCLKLRNIKLLIWFPTINSTSHRLSHPSHSLYSYFYPKGAVLPKPGIITIICSRDMTSITIIHHNKRIKWKFSMLDFFSSLFSEFFVLWYW